MDLLTSSYLILTGAVLVSLVFYGYYTMRLYRSRAKEERVSLTPNFFILAGISAYLIEVLILDIQLLAFGGIIGGFMSPMRLAFGVIYGGSYGIAVLWMLDRRKFISLIVVLAVLGESMVFTFGLPGPLLSFSIWAACTSIVTFMPIFAFLFVYNVSRKVSPRAKSLTIALMLNYLFITMWAIIASSELFPGIENTLILPILSLGTAFTSLLLSTLCASRRFVINWESIGYSASFVVLFVNVAVFSLVAAFTTSLLIFLVLVELGAALALLNGWYSIGRYIKDRQAASLLLGAALLLTGTSSMLYFYVLAATPIVELTKATLATMLIADALICFALVVAGRITVVASLFTLLVGLSMGFLFFIPGLSAMSLYAIVGMLVSFMVFAFFMLVRAARSMEPGKRLRPAELAIAVFVLFDSQVDFTFTLFPPAEAAWVTAFLNNSWLFFPLWGFFFFASSLLLFDALIRRRPSATRTIKTTK